VYLYLIEPLKFWSRRRNEAPVRLMCSPGSKGTRPLSDMVFLMTLGRMELNITAHGFRSCFSGRKVRVLAFGAAVLA
jgi:hypothetical protein